MAIRKLRLYGDPILTKSGKDVTDMSPRVVQLITDMFETLRDADGVGLAAPQVGVLKNIFVIDVTGDDPRVFINAEILESAGSVEDDEGCLSLPGKHGKVVRPEYVKVKYRNKDFAEMTEELEGLMARAFCHEHDHLVGKMFVELVDGDLYDVDPKHTRRNQR